MKKFKENFTIETYLGKLDQAGSHYKKSIGSHRQELRKALQTAQLAIVKFLNNKKLRSQFKKAVRDGKEESNRPQTKPFDLSLEAVARATGALTRDARKLASKRARVLDHLRSKSVKVKDTAAFLKNEGIERLYLEARSDKPPMERARKSVAVPLFPLPKRESGHFGQNDKLVVFSVQAKLSDRDRFLETKMGDQFSILVSRVGKNHDDFRVVYTKGDDQKKYDTEW